MPDPNPYAQFAAPPPPQSDSGGANDNPYAQFAGSNSQAPSEGQQRTDQLLHDLTPAPRTQGEDIQQGVASGLVSGSAGILGMPVDLWRMLKAGNKYALTKGAEAAGVITPEQGAEYRKMTPAEDDPMSSAWITSHVKNLAQAAGRDTSAPQTVPGQYAETAAAFLPQAAAVPFAGEGTAAEMAGKVPAAMLRYGVLPAAASETAGQMTKGTAAEPYARIAGAIGPEAAMQAAGAARNALSPVRDILGGASDQDLTDAQRLLDESRAANAPLTVPEAVQKATGSGTRAGDIQRVVEQSPRGANIMRPFMAQRPAQTEALGQQMLDQISPSTMDPYEVAPRVQGAAQGVLSDADRARSQAVKPLYDAAKTDQVPQNEMEGLIGQIDDLMAQDKTGILHPKLQDLRDRLTTMAPASTEPRTIAGPSGSTPSSPMMPAPRKPQSLVDFLISQGGVQDQGGELSSMGADTVHHQAAGRLMNPRGLQPDYAREAAAEAGFLPPNASLNDFYDALAEHVSGRPQYRLGDQAAGEAWEQSRREGLQEENARDNAVSGINDILNGSGTRLSKSELDHATNLTMNGMHPQEAVETAARAAQESAVQSNAAASAPGTAGAPEVLRDMAQRTPITDIENLDRARKFFRDQIAQPAIAQDAVPKEIGGKTGDILNNLRSIMVRGSPNFAEAKDLYQKISQSVVNPLQRSPIGQLAGADTYPKQAAILFNPNPLPGSENAIGSAVRQVAKADPDAASQMVRLNVEKAFNEATQNNLPGANQFGAPKFAAVVAGNSQQAKNLEAAVRALPNGDLRWNAFRKGLDIMEGMGTRQPVGSQTAFNAQINKWMEQGHPAGEFLANAASPGRWPSLVDKIYRHVIYDKNTAELARVFTSGDVADLKAIAGSGSRSFQGQAALIGALARQGVSSGSPTTQASP